MKQEKITARILLEVLGSPKEHVEEALQEVIEKLKKEEKLVLLNAKVYKTEQLKNKFWSAFTEVEFTADSIKDVLDMCFDYTPSTLEVLEPAGLELDTEYLAGIFNDLLAKIHQYVAVIKNFEAENQILQSELKKKS